jgi:ribosomal protein S17E
MAKFEDILKEGTNLSEEVRTQIQEAWETRLNEAKEELTAELREEFAQKFEHDKTVMIESVDKFLTDKVRSEIAEFAQDKKALAEERVRYKARVSEHVKMLEKFIATTLAKEVKELREDRSRMTGNVKKLEDFVLRQLAEEVQEFHNDKKALAEQRVKLVREGKRELAETKTAFVKKAAQVIEENINSVLRTEITQYRNDTRAARENDFGRRIFEAFVSEYMGSYLNESGEVNKLQAALKSLSKQLDEAKVAAAQQKQINEATERKLKAAQDRVNREKTMNDLLAPLGKRQKAVMVELLQTVKTEKLAESFKKYLPAVLNEDKATPQTETRSPLNESVRTAKTGDRRASAAQQEDESREAADIQEIKKLAGIK